MGHYYILRTIKTPFLISTRNEWSVRIWDVPYYMQTSYETILLQHFQDMGHYYILRTIKTPFLISTRNEWSVLIWDVPYYMHTSYETILLQRFQDMGHYYILRTIKTPFLISTRNEWSVLIWTSHTICRPHMKPFYCSIFKIWDIITFRGV